MAPKQPLGYLRRDPTRASVPVSQPSIEPRAPCLTVSVNGEPYTVPSGCNVAWLVGQLGLAGQKIAVAVNREVVPRSRFGAQTLAQGDRIEVLEAVGGG